MSNTMNMEQIIAQVTASVLAAMQEAPVEVPKATVKQPTINPNAPKWTAYRNTAQVEETSKKSSKPSVERKDDLYDDGEIIVHKDFTVDVVCKCSRERFQKMQRDLYAYCKAAGATWIRVDKDVWFLTFTSDLQVKRLADNRKFQFEQQKLNDQRLGR